LEIGIEGRNGARREKLLLDCLMIVSME
jgi:hypothetical protein